MQEAVMVMGSPASGKSTVAQSYIDKGYVHLNRDKRGGRTRALVPLFEQEINQGANVVLDNTFVSAEKRSWFIRVAQKLKVPIRCEWVATSMEDCSINALHRMWDRYGQIFFTPNDIKEHDEASKDPNMFPIVVLFTYKKELEKPSLEEGFSDLKKIPFERRPSTAKNKALILDYDDTLRTVTQGDFKFPTSPKEIKILPNRKKVLKQYKKDGYILLGVSNQSGIARKQVTEDVAKECFAVTNKKLEVDIHATYCPHNVPPTCYCRKPQSGLGVYLIRKYDLNPAETIYVGDQTSDKTFAKRLGFEYAEAKAFFK